MGNTRDLCLRLMKRSLRLAKKWNAVNVSDTEAERRHLRSLVEDEYRMSKVAVKITRQDIVALNARLDMIEHYKTPYERPTHYAQHASVLDFHQLKSQKTLAKRAKLPNTKQNTPSSD